MTLNETLTYKSWLREQRLSDTTIYRRLNLYRRIRTEIGDPATITGEQITTWLNHYRGWTATSYYAGMQSIMRFLLETGRRSENPMCRMRPPKKPDPTPRPLSREDMDMLLGSAVGMLRDWLLLALLQGLRAHEVAKVRGEDITRSHFYVCGKGQQVALLPTHPAVWEVSQRYPRQGWWFPSPRDASTHVTPGWVTLSVSNLFDQYGLAGSIHRVRATYGTNLLRNGENIAVVQRLLRHQQLTSTQHYLGVDQDELTRAIRGLPA